MQGELQSAFPKFKDRPPHLSLSQYANGAAKYNIPVDIITQHVKSQQALIEYIKNKGMLEHVPQPIQDQLNSVYEFAKIMEKQNGKKQNPISQKKTNHKKPTLTG